MPCLDATLAIASGGRARRMGGKNKGALLVDGQSIMSRQLQVLGPLFARTVLSTTPDFAGEVPSGVGIVRDATPYKGPLAGLRQVLRQIGGAVFWLGGDMPWPSPELAQFLTTKVLEGHYDAAAVRAQQRLQTCHAAYGPQVTTLATSHRAMRDIFGENELNTLVLEHQDLGDICPDDRFATSIDEPADLT